MATAGIKPTDLRSKSRASLRAEIAEVAFKVFAERGFDQVTATEVAAAAGVSRASFFRYFDSKEDAVFVVQEELGVDVAEALAERPDGEDAWTALRQAIVIGLRPYESDPEEMLARLRLIRCTPSLRSRQLDRMDQWKKVIGASLARRLGAAEGEITAAALVAAGLGAFDAALTRWSESDGTLDLVALIDEAFEAVAAPFPRLGADI